MLWLITGAVWIIGFSLWLWSREREWRIALQHQVASLANDLKEMNNLRQRAVISLWEVERECRRLQDALDQVRGVITRRPPRRRWLAIARRVAKITGGAA